MTMPVKKKILQINPKEPDEPPVIFEYYLEYGEDGIVAVRCEGAVVYAPFYALARFVDSFRSEMG